MERTREAGQGGVPARSTTTRTTDWTTARVAREAALTDEATGLQMELDTGWTRAPEGALAVGLAPTEAPSTEAPGTTPEERTITFLTQPATRAEPTSTTTRAHVPVETRTRTQVTRVFATTQPEVGGATTTATEPEAKGQVRTEMRTVQTANDEAEG